MNHSTFTLASFFCNKVCATNFCANHMLLFVEFQTVDLIVFYWIHIIFLKPFFNHSIFLEYLLSFLPTFLMMPSKCTCFPSFSATRLLIKTVSFTTMTRLEWEINLVLMDLLTIFNFAIAVEANF